MLNRRRRHGDEPAADLPQAPYADPGLPVTDGAVVIVEDSTFLALTEGRYTVVDFWAGWCAPCRQFAPIFRAVAREHTGSVRFGACDVDANPGVAQLLQIRSIPTLVVFGPDGSEVGRSAGVVSRGDLEATVAQLSRR
jgi:thioredoxin